MKSSWILLVLGVVSCASAGQYAVLTISGGTQSNPNVTESRTFTSVSLFSTFGNITTASGTPLYRFLGQSAFELEDGCSMLPSSSRPWIAIVSRGTCMFTTKAYDAAAAGAAGVVIVDNNVSPTPIIMDGSFSSPSVGSKIPSVSLTYTSAFQLVSFLEAHVNVVLTIAPGDQVDDGTFDSTDDVHTLLMSNLVVGVAVVAAISFCVMFAFYCRSRRLLTMLRTQHQHQQQSELHLEEARALLQRLPTRSFISLNLPPTTECAGSDPATDAPLCVVCLEEFKDGDMLRVLPCKHEMHQACVDPWLSDHATCPLCKRDICDADAAAKATSPTTLDLNGQALVEVVTANPLLAATAEASAAEGVVDFETSAMGPEARKKERSTLVVLDVTGDDC